MTTLWGGRFNAKLDEQAFTLNASLAFDKQLAQQDVKGSVAWADALTQAGVLTQTESKQIISGLEGIAVEFESRSFNFDASDEDIHSAVERRLGELIGPLAGKLHTGRSRNDQVATDFRLWMLDALPVLDVAIKGFQSSLVTVAEPHRFTLMPGYTHLQRAQPVTLAHWLLSHFWALQRDRDRLADLRDRVAILPLGCGALAGTAFPVDRESLTKALGFDAPAPNSLDAVSDRDFAAEYLFCTAMIGVHLSKLAENVILFTTAEFGFFELSDAFSTGSSLMPQKKNPDIFELARGKAGTLIGLLVGLLSTLKGLPSTYDKDLQEDKMPVFQSTDTLMAILPVLAGALETMTVNKKRMLAAIDSFTLATDLADYLVRKGVPFREAHGIVGKAVLLAAEKGASLEKLTLNEWQALGSFDADVYQVFDPMKSVEQRNSIGGTSPLSVEKQIQKANFLIQGD
ncbi:MAG: argininosuccinate lyase [Chloroflexi bacterium GWB2_49_20]|nr:MAG: argininosuccinate lyase [Chloroflexi bacterium GWB2_49_20]OGN77753.1 MAG: argininosuccinate lyase [Chloroflexi bacterium GWC2_49_37]OGN86528.1 MAG: argininosuccinate lyase [Chloroflexi bacterium GWD2_49_16]HBG74781.1 argininosuccinate lyase [Anaerolineae bacterium]